MRTKLSSTARTYLVLLACLLVVGLPSGRLTLCDCLGLLVGSAADACPDSPAERRATDRSDPGEEHALQHAECCGGHEVEPGDCPTEEPGGPGESCCNELSTFRLGVLAGAARTSAEAIAKDPDHEPGQGFLSSADAVRVRSRLVAATGPPRWHRLRPLDERASVVLLI